MQILAKAFGGVIPVFKVNCRSAGAAQICATQEVQNWPSFGYFGYQSDPLDRTTSEATRTSFRPSLKKNQVLVDLANWLSDQMPHFCSILFRPTSDQVQNWLLTKGQKGNRVPLVFFNKRLLIPVLIKKISTIFWEHVNILVVSSVHDLPALRRNLGLTLYPIFVHYANPFLFLKGDDLLFMNKPSLEEISKFVRRVIQTHRQTLKTAWLGQFTYLHWRAGHCQSSDSGFCVFYLTTLGFEINLDHAHLLTNLGLRFARDPLKLFWVPRHVLESSVFRDSFPEAVYKHEDLKPEMNAGLLIVFRPASARYALYSSSLANEGLAAQFIEKLLIRGTPLPLQGAPLGYPVD